MTTQEEQRMSEERALTGSGKWHIVNPDHSHASRYAVARCGTFVYRDDDPHYPDHLKRIKAGTKKSTGICKLCARSSGVKTVTVELPEPNEHPQVIGNREWPVDSCGMSGVKVVIRASDGRIANDGVNNPYQTAADARSHAAALLAAAAALESGQS